MSRNDIKKQILYDEARETQDRFVTQFIQQQFNVPTSEAIRIWFSSKTKERIQNSEIQDIRMAYPTMCFGELEKELSENSMWFHSPF